MSQKVDIFLDKTKNWKQEMTLLREICLSCGLNEDFKWMKPCYDFKGKNIVLIHGFKDYCALLFHKGVLMQDSKRILIQQTENVQAARQLRFTNTKQINDSRTIIKAYIFEAIEVEEAGLSVEMKKTEEFDTPIELTETFKKDLQFKKAFEALTPGRQRGYLLFFSQAKQSKTRRDRIEKYHAQILMGKGLNDR